MTIYTKCPHCHTENKTDVQTIDELITEAEESLAKNPDDSSEAERKNEYESYKREHPNSKFFLTELHVLDINCSDCGKKYSICDSDN